MHTRSGLVSVAVLLVACATNPDPRKRPIELVQRDGHGGWVIVDRIGDGPAVTGELISVERDRLRVLDGLRLIVVPRAQIRSAELWAWETQEGRLAAWGTVGTLSTISHGILLVVSAPVWIVSSGAAAGAESRASRLTYPSDHWEELVKWSRFPQGLPAGIDAAALAHQARTPPPAPLPPEPPAQEPQPGPVLGPAPAPTQPSVAR